MDEDVSQKHEAVACFPSSNPLFANEEVVCQLGCNLKVKRMKLRKHDCVACLKVVIEKGCSFGIKECSINRDRDGKFTT